MRDGEDRVVGFLGRDVAGLAHRPKYLNSPQSAIYDKAGLLYRATRRDGRVPLVIVEGSLDALALDAIAARSGAELRAVSPSGTALTVAQQALAAAEAAGPPVLCPDGDAAGRRAATSWVIAMTVAGQEVLAVTLPDSHDPASWLELHGTEGLAAFERKARSGSSRAADGRLATAAAAADWSPPRRRSPPRATPRRGWPEPRRIRRGVDFVDPRAGRISLAACADSILADRVLADRTNRRAQRYRAEFQKRRTVLR